MDESNSSHGVLKWVRNVGGELLSALAGPFRPELDAADGDSATLCKDTLNHVTRRAHGDSKAAHLRRSPSFGDSENVRPSFALWHAPKLTGFGGARRNVAK